MPVSRWRMSTGMSDGLISAWHAEWPWRMGGQVLSKRHNASNEEEADRVWAEHHDEAECIHQVRTFCSPTRSTRHARGVSARQAIVKDNNQHEVSSSAAGFRLVPVCAADVLVSTAVKLMCGHHYRRFWNRVLSACCPMWDVHPDMVRSNPGKVKAEQERTPTDLFLLPTPPPWWSRHSFSF
jgi:hypothetical protein